MSKITLEKIINNAIDDILSDTKSITSETITKSAINETEYPKDEYYLVKTMLKDDLPISLSIKFYYDNSKSKYILLIYATATKFALPNFQIKIVPPKNIKFETYEPPSPEILEDENGHLYSKKLILGGTQLILYIVIFSPECNGIGKLSIRIKTDLGPDQYESEELGSFINFTKASFKCPTQKLTVQTIDNQKGYVKVESNEIQESDFYHIDLNQFYHWKNPCTYWNSDRFANQPGAFKLGAIYSPVPPTQINFVEGNNLSSIGIPRSIGNYHLPTTNDYMQFTVNFIFPNLEAINGKRGVEIGKLPGNDYDSGIAYCMSTQPGLIDILAQILRMPILPIENYHIKSIIYPRLYKIKDTVKENINYREFEDPVKSMQNIVNSQVETAIKINEDESPIYLKDLELKDNLKVKHNNNLRNAQDIIEGSKLAEEENDLQKIKELDPDQVGITEKDAQTFVIIRQVNIATIPHKPEALSVDLIFDIFNHVPYGGVVEYIKDLPSAKQQDTLIAELYKTTFRYYESEDPYGTISSGIKKFQNQIESVSDISLCLPFQKYYRGLIEGEPENWVIPALGNKLKPLKKVEAFTRLKLTQRVIDTKTIERNIKFSNRLDLAKDTVLLQIFNHLNPKNPDKAQHMSVGDIIMYLFAKNSPATVPMIDKLVMYMIMLAKIIKNRYLIREFVNESIKNLELAFQDIKNRILREIDHQSSKTKVDTSSFEYYYNIFTRYIIYVTTKDYKKITTVGTNDDLIIFLDILGKNEENVTNTDRLYLYFILLAVIRLLKSSLLLSTVKQAYLPKIVYIGDGEITNITGISASYSIKTTPIKMESYNIPTYQYFGASGWNITVNIRTTDMDLVRALRDLEYSLAESARAYEQVETEIADIMSLYDLSAEVESNGTLFDLLGIKKVIINSIQFSNVDGHPNTFDISLNMVQNDINIYEREKLMRQYQGGDIGLLVSNAKNVYNTLLNVVKNIITHQETSDDKYIFTVFNRLYDEIYGNANRNSYKIVRDYVIKNQVFVHFLAMDQLEKYYGYRITTIRKSLANYKKNNIINEDTYKFISELLSHTVMSAIATKLNIGEQEIVDHDYIEYNKLSNLPYRWNLNASLNNDNPDEVARKILNGVLLNMYIYDSLGEPSPSLRKMIMSLFNLEYDAVFDNKPVLSAIYSILNKILSISEYRKDLSLLLQYADFKKQENTSFIKDRQNAKPLEIGQHLYDDLYLPDETGYLLPAFFFRRSFPDYNMYLDALNAIDEDMSMISQLYKLLSPNLRTWKEKKQISQAFSFYDLSESVSMVNKLKHKLKEAEETQNVPVSGIDLMTKVIEEGSSDYVNPREAEKLAASKFGDTYKNIQSSLYLFGLDGGALDERLSYYFQDQINKQYQEYLSSVIGDTSKYDSLVQAVFDFDVAQRQQIFNRIKMQAILLNHRLNLNVFGHSLARAFPTCRVYIVESTELFELIGLPSNTIAYNNVYSIEIQQDVDQAGDVAVINLVNITKNLIDNRWSMRKNGLLFRMAPANSILIQPGTRIVVKMGYVNNDIYLPTVFVGTVSDIKPNSGNGIIQIIAHGFGYELTEDITQGEGIKYGKLSDVGTYGDVVMRLIERAHLYNFGRNTLLKILHRNPVIYEHIVKKLDFSKFLSFNLVGQLLNNEIKKPIKLEKETKKIGKASKTTKKKSKKVKKSKNIIKKTKSYLSQKVGLGKITGILALFGLHYFFGQKLTKLFLALDTISPFVGNSIYGYKKGEVPTAFIGQSANAWIFNRLLYKFTGFDFYDYQKYENIYASFTIGIETWSKKVGHFINWFTGLGTIWNMLIPIWKQIGGLLYTLRATGLFGAKNFVESYLKVRNSIWSIFRTPFNFSWVVMPGTSLFDALRELALYHRNYIVSALPYNYEATELSKIRKTLYFGPEDGVYKCTDLFDNVFKDSLRQPYKLNSDNIKNNLEKISKFDVNSIVGTLKNVRLFGTFKSTELKTNVSKIKNAKHIIPVYHRKNPEQFVTKNGTLFPGYKFVSDTHLITDLFHIIQNTVRASMEESYNEVIVNCPKDPTFKDKKHVKTYRAWCGAHPGTMNNHTFVTYQRNVDPIALKDTLLITVLVGRVLGLYKQYHKNIMKNIPKNIVKKNKIFHKNLPGSGTLKSKDYELRYLLKSYKDNEHTLILNLFVKPKSIVYGQIVYPVFFSLTLFGLNAKNKNDITAKITYGGVYESVYNTQKKSGIGSFNFLDEYRRNENQYNLILQNPKAWQNLQITINAKSLAPITYLKVQLAYDYKPNPGNNVKYIELDIQNTIKRNTKNPIKLSRPTEQDLPINYLKAAYELPDHSRLSRLIPIGYLVAAEILKNVIRPMYQGYIKILGDPTIKKWDKIVLMDNKTKMTGIAVVRKVIHIFSPEEGFYSLIQPMVIASSKSYESFQLPMELYNIGLISYASSVIIPTLFGGIFGAMNGKWLGAILGSAGGLIGGHFLGKYILTLLGVDQLGARSVVLMPLLLENRPFGAHLDKFSTQEVLVKFRSDLQRLSEVPDVILNTIVGYGVQTLNNLNKLSQQ
ncbi:MAG: hypothetical protein ACTSWR_08245 [Candidatus Helarchaeota archaeon]